MTDMKTARAPFPLRQHQIDGVEALLKHPYFMLADECGAGKSAQIIAASQLLWEDDKINLVVVLCPAQARGTWANPDPALGEVAKHRWKGLPNTIIEFSVLHPRIRVPGEAGWDDHLIWLVTNYEYIRRPEHLNELLKFCQFYDKVWLVCDEAWALKNHGTQQWKAVNQVRQLAGRVTLLNGTPVADTPLDLNSQMQILDPKILGFRYVDARGHPKISNADSRFWNYYGGLAPLPSLQQRIIWGKQPLDQRWPRLEELRERVAPYVLRRLVDDCFDLPEELEPILLEAPLDPPTWKLYKEMRDEMVAWLSTSEMSMAQQAIVKGMRLAQICSGFLGGVSNWTLDGEAGLPPLAPLRELSREKLSVVLRWLNQLNPTPDRVLIWGRFRAEIERAARVIRDDSKPTRDAFLLYGGQTPEERNVALRSLNPDLPVARPVAVVGSRGAGGAAVNLSGASVEINLSYSFLLREYLQARGRTRRPGQRFRLQRVDVVATGPGGQRTIDSHVLAALREKCDIASWTMATWAKKLLDE